MLHTPYTTLHDLITAEDPAVTSIFEQCAAETRQQRNVAKPHPSRTKGTLFHLTTVGRLISEDDAADRMREILMTIRNAGNDFYGGMSELQKVLTNEGIFKLMQVLASHPVDDEAAVAQVLSPIDQLQSLFRGLPLFNIVVVDICANANNDKIDITKAKHLRGRYDVYLEKRISNERFLINFDTKEAKVLFIWFLLNSRKEFKKMHLVNKAEEFIQLFDTCHPLTKENTIEKKMRHPEEKKGDRDGFEQFWNHSKGRANNAIVTTLGERDNAAWYIVDLTDGLYSLSLPDEYIRLPQSLKDSIL